MSRGETKSMGTVFKVMQSIIFRSSVPKNKINNLN